MKAAICSPSKIISDQIIYFKLFVQFQIISYLCIDFFKLGCYRSRLATTYRAMKSLQRTFQVVGLHFFLLGNVATATAMSTTSYVWVTEFFKEALSYTFPSSADCLMTKRMFAEVPCAHTTSSILRVTNVYFCRTYKVVKRRCRSDSSMMDHKPADYGWLYVIFDVSGTVFQAERVALCYLELFILIH